MGHNSGKMQLISAAILVGILMSLFGMPLNRLNNYPTCIITTGGNPKSPSVAAYDLDADYFQKYLDSVLFELYNFSRDTNTEFGLENTYFHLLSNNWSTVVGAKDKYSFDNILTFLGPWGLKLGQQGPIIKSGTFNWFNSAVVSTGLYHQFNSSTIADTGAFRRKMDQNGTSLDDTFLMEDNALGLLGLLEYAGALADEDAAALALYLWNYLTNTLWQPDSDYHYSYFAPQNGTELGQEILGFQNLLGAFVESMVARSGVSSLSGYIKTQAAEIAQQAFSAVNRSGILDGIGGNPYDYTFFENEHTHDRILLKTNALGIATLADFYIRSGRAEGNKSALDQAETLYQVVCDFFENLTFSPQGAFMDDLTPFGNGRSVQTTLDSNAYWLLALARLFEASGNITYYEKGIEVYNQVVANLWDSTNLGFNRTRGYFSNDTTKSVGENALLFYALQELDRSYWQVELAIIQSPPDCVIQTNPILNLTCQYNITWVRDFSSAFGLNYTIKQAIAGANVSFSIRYPNGTFITQLQNYTDVNGTFNLLYPLPADLPLGTYAIHGYANRTGFGTGYFYKQFSIISNVSMSKVDSALKVIQGESSKFNITFSSTRNNASWVFFNGTGTELNVSAQTFLLANNTTTEVTTNFTADSTALIGVHNATFSLVNDSVTLCEFTLQIEVSPAVSLDVIEYTQKIVVGVNGEIYVVLENARPVALETANISLRGIDIQAFTQNISLQGGERKRIYVPLRFTGSYNTGSLNFEVNISRYSQVLDSKTYSAALVPAIEVASISTSAAVIQGREFYINFHATNNLNVTQLVDLYINGEIAQADIPLIPGENYVIVSRAPLTFNPWDFTTFPIDVTLKVNDNDIFQDRLLIQTVVSVENVLCFYVLPIVLPIAAVLIFLQRQKKRELLR